MSHKGLSPITSEFSQPPLARKYKWRDVSRGMGDSHGAHVPFRKLSSLFWNPEIEEKIFLCCYFILISLSAYHQSYNHDYKSFVLIFACCFFFCLPIVDIA